MNNKYLMKLFLILLILLIITACTQKSSFPTGTFISENGNRTLTFSDDGKFRFISASADDSGTYSIQGNELTWETDRYCEALNAGKATYTWTYKNDTLLINVKGEDTCADRKAVIDNIPYHKQP